MLAINYMQLTGPIFQSISDVATKARKSQKREDFQRNPKFCNSGCLYTAIVVYTAAGSSTNTIPANNDLLIDKCNHSAFRRPILDKSLPK